MGTAPQCEHRCSMGARRAQHVNVVCYAVVVGDY